MKKQRRSHGLALPGHGNRRFSFYRFLFRGYFISGRVGSVTNRAKLALWDRGWFKTYAVMYCPGCNYETRWVYKARKHECNNADRSARRRIARAATKSSTIFVGQGRTEGV